jgi:ADP-ribosyl-[dinitrogen reductase] hydrolase
MIHEPTDRTALIGRFRGALLGLAVGDAVGTTLEFQLPGSFAPISDMGGGGPFGLKPGQWTDDTSMALCLAASLVECQGFDARDQMDRYVRWWHQGYMSSTGRCFDIGVTVRSALQRYLLTGDPYAGSTDPHTAGNGSIMRLAPVVLAYAHDSATAIERASDSSRTTHATRTAVDGCRYLAALLIGALHGETKATLLASCYSPIPGYWDNHPLSPAIDTVAAGSFKEKQPPVIRGTGYVVASLEAALWAFSHSDTFRDGCLLAVNLGDDADTTGAVYGQLAGAFYGETAIPAAWRERLTQRDLMVQLVDDLLSLSQGRR